jgi:hypothetical protein
VTLPMRRDAYLGKMTINVEMIQQKHTLSCRLDSFQSYCKSCESLANVAEPLCLK